MKNILAILVCAFALGACVTAENKTDYTAYVNPFIGTGGHGHTFPGAVVPHGMIQPSPDTRIDGWDACSGYHYSDSMLNGFTQSHLSGTGCADYGDFLLMPTCGNQIIDNQIDTVQNRPFASSFSHADETATPGYYSTFLKRYGIKAEVTATERAALYRFTYTKGKDAGLILDLDYSIQNQTNLDMEIEVLGDSAVRAYKMTKYWAFDQQLSMYAQFSKPFTCKIINDTIIDSNGHDFVRCKALLRFSDIADNEELFVKVGVSAVDWDGAEKNVRSEISSWDFDKIRNAAHDKWNNYLSTIEIEADDDADKTIFYTAMYHAAISPNLFMDVDGRYLGMDRKTHQGNPDKPVYTVFSLWDTHRALHPLLTIIDPKLNNDFINSLLLKHEEGGLLPMWELAGNYTATMTGYHAVSLMADAVTKGLADFDVNKALKAGLRTSVCDTTGIATPELVKVALMPKSKEYKNSLGFIPWDKEYESVAKGLEYAYDDWCNRRQCDRRRLQNQRIGLQAVF